MGKGKGAVLGPSGTGMFATVQNLIKPFIGAGILAMPSAWMDGGIAASSTMLVLLAFVAGWAIFKLVECADVIMLVEARHAMRLRVAEEKRMQQAIATGMSVEEYKSRKASEQDSDKQFEDYFLLDPTDDQSITAEDWKHVALPTFADIGACAFGPWGRRIVDYCIVIAQLGACIAYTIFISQNFGEVVSAVKAKYWVLAFFVPLLSLALIKRIDRLAPAAVLGNIVYAFTIIVIFYVGFDRGFPMKSSEVHWINAEKLPLVFGTCSFALEGIPLILPIKARMKDPNQFPRAMLVAMFIVSMLYMVFANMGYLFFGNNTKSPVIQSMPNGALTDTVKISLAISLFFTFGLQVFPISTFFDFLIDDKLGIDLAAAKKRRYDEVRDILRASAISSTPSPTAIPESAKLLDNSQRQSALDSSDVGSSRRELRLSISNQNVAIVEETRADGGSTLRIGVEEHPSSRFPAHVNRTVNSEWGLVEEIHVPDNIRAYYPELHFKRRLFRFLARLGIVLFCCTIAITFADFKLIIALFGSFSNALLAYILPSLFWVRIVSSRILFGFDYFPYDRQGRPLTHPFKAGQRPDSEDSDGSVNTPPHPRTRRGSLEYSLVDQDAPETDEAKATEALVSGSGVDALQPTTKTKVSTLWLPVTVAVVGILASIVGFADAIKDIVNKFK